MKSTEQSNVEECFDFISGGEDFAYSSRSDKKFITIEGIDGCGKTTQARLFSAWLAESFGAENVVHTFEPGGAGLEIRKLVLEGDFSPRSELLLFLADRMEHVRKKIAPALGAGKWVVCERYTDSTLAYQAMRGIPVGDIEKFFAWCEFPRPDLTFLLDISAEKAASRMVSRGGRKDNFERAGLEFMSSLRSRYIELARAERFVVIDAELLVDEVALAMRDAFRERLFP